MIAIEKFDNTSRNQLASPDGCYDVTFVAPRTPDEELLADIWASVLGLVVVLKKIHSENSIM